jgi:hypothetical protein
MPQFEPQGPQGGPFGGGGPEIPGGFSQGPFSHPGPYTPAPEHLYPPPMGEMRLVYKGHPL